MAPADGPPERIRVDKWLWAARLLKTRALAAEAVRGGRVEVNGQRIRPSKDVRAGDTLELTTGPVRLTVVVRGIAARRGPATEAVELYDETPESRTARERHAAQRRLAAEPVPETAARPTKRDRRRFEAARASRRGRA